MWATNNITPVSVGTSPTLTYTYMGTILEYGGCGTRMDRDRRSDRALLGAMGRVMPKMAMASRWVRFFDEKSVKKKLFKNIYFIAS